MSLKIKRGSLVDLAKILKNLRQADLNEIRAHGQNALWALLTAYFRSDCKFVYADKEPIAIFGIRKVKPGYGIIYLLGTNNIRTFHRSFLRQSKEELLTLMKENNVRYAYNLVHNENVIHIKWLRWLGFAIKPHNKTFSSLWYSA